MFIKNHILVFGVIIVTVYVNTLIGHTMDAMQYRLRIFMIFSLWGILGFLSPMQAQIALYDIHEIVLEGQTFENPYLENRVYATLSGPNSETYDIEAFWNGDSTYIVRVAPQAVGQWTWEIHSPTDSTLDGLTGSFQCDTSDHRGFLTTNGMRFEYTNGEPVFRMGDTNWRMFRSKNADYDSLFIPYVDARAGQGFNYIAGVIHTVADTSSNEGGPLWINEDLDTLNPGYFEWVDKRIEYLNSKGITVGILFVWAQTFNDFTRDQFTRFRRYVVGRYTAYDVVWVISGEYSERDTWEDYWPDEYSYHAERIKNGDAHDSGDPYGHPISIHPSGDESNTQDYDLFQGWLSFAMQQYDGTPDILYDQIQADRIYDIPVANDEYGYEGPTTDGQEYYHPSNQNADNIRRDSWAIVMAGGQFTYGHINTCTAKERPINLDSLNTEGALYLKTLKSFVTDSIPYFEMQPDTSFILAGNAFGMSKSDSVYMAYCPDSTGLDIQLNCSRPLFHARWYNPKLDYSVSAGILSSNETHQLATPFSHDAVLLLTGMPAPIARVRLYLEGPYRISDEKMHTQLYQQGHISTLSPYSEDPRQVNSVPDSVVDWVLVEFLNTPEGPAQFSKSFLLSESGYLISECCDSHYIDLSELPDDDYYLKVHHRNHKSLISSTTLTFGADRLTEFDFTTASSQYYDQESAKQLMSGIWGVKGGDVNRDDSINDMDFNSWHQSALQGDSGYLVADVNLDGLVTTMDFTIILNN